MSQSKLSRKKATILIAIILFVLSIPLNLNIDLFNKFSDVITIVVSPLAALIVLIVFYFMRDKEEVLNEINMGAKRKVNFKWR